jgi:hypothetical protein
VRGQTIKYNSKQKLGRGFTLEELKVRTQQQQQQQLQQQQQTVSGALRVVEYAGSSSSRSASRGAAWGCVCRHREYLGTCVCVGGGVGGVQEG